MKTKTLACLTLWALLQPAAFAAIINAPASGAITTPRGTVTGMLTAIVAATDPDGLNRVSMVLAPGGDPVVFCDDDDAAYPVCTGISWSRADIDPSDHGVTGDGLTSIGLWVRDDLGWTSLVAQETIDYNVGSDASGQIRAPRGAYAGDVTLSAIASDPAGISRVAFDFGAGTSEVVLCEPCSGNSWALGNVDPGAYGASPGVLTARLRIRAGGINKLVAYHDFEWQSVSGSQPSGWIGSPNDLVTGDVMIVAAAGDPDGLERVAIQIGNGEEVLCAGVADPCFGTNDGWHHGSVDPGSYGLNPSGPIAVPLTLAVTDDGGGFDTPVQHSFTWEPAALRAADGTILDITDNGDGTVEADVTVSDPDGLFKVSLVFVAAGTPYVLCHDGTTDSCPPTSSTSFLEPGIDPRAHGATAGSVTVGLWVQDDTGRAEAVDDYTFTYSPPASEGALSVTPSSNFNTSGEEGGPFGDLNDYTVENTGNADLDYGVLITYSPQAGNWLNAGDVQGNLGPGATRSVNLSINAIADNLTADTYTATLDFVNQTNGLGDTERTVTLTVDPATTLPPRIGGRITDTSGNPIEGVRIDGMPIIHWTDTNGEYGRVVGEGWSGTISPSKAGFTFVPASVPYTNVTVSLLNEDYVGTGTQLTIAGRITSGITGVEGVTLNGLPGSPMTAADGTYSVGVPFRFTGEVTPTKVGYVFTPPSLPYDDLRGSRFDQDYTATVETVTISGQVTRGASGLSGVWLNGLPGGITTAADGTYSAEVPRGWIGTVTPQRTGYAFTPPARTYADVQGGEPSDYSASTLPAGSHRLWLVADDTEMQEATILNRTGDMILVEPGTYNNVDAGGIDPGVTLLSTGGADATIFQRTGSHHHFNQDDVIVDGFTFETSVATEAVQVFGNGVKIRNSRFRPLAGEYGLRLSTASEFLIEGSVFEQGDGITIRPGTAIGETAIRNNEFNNLGRGLGTSANPDLRIRLENNIFRNVTDAVEIGACQQVTIQNNLFAEVSSRGIELDDITQQSSLLHNVFYRNGQAIDVCDASILVYNSIFQENTKSIDGCSRGTVNVHHDLIWQGTWLWAGPVYITDPDTIWRDIWDPQFIDPANGDFHLDPSSEAGGRGTGGSDLGAYGGALGNAWAPVPGTPQAAPALLDIRLDGQLELSAGATIVLVAEGDFENGFYAKLAKKAAWTSSNEAVLRSLGNGLFESLTPGTVTVTASYGGLSEQVQVTVLAAALVLSATDTPDPVLAGGGLEYSLSWRNDGPGVARGARLVVAYDPRTTNPSPSTPPDAGTNNTWTLGDLQAGAVGALTVTVDVDGGLVEGDVLSFEGTLVTDFQGPRTASTTTTVTGQPDLSVTKTCDAPQAFPGSEVTCLLAWSNGGSGTAPGARLEESYPSGVTFLRARPSPSSGNALWLLGDVGPGAQGSVEVDLLIDDATIGNVVNQSEILSDVSDLDFSDNTDTFTIEVTPWADLTLTLSDSPDPAPIGADLTYTIVVANQGPSDAPNVVVTDTLPTDLSSVVTNGCTEDPGGVPDCDLGTISAGTSKQFTLTVVPTSAGSILNTACVASGVPDASPGDECATEDTLIETSVDLAITKNDDQDPVVPGALLTYTLTVTNLGPSSSTGGQVTDVLPAELSFASSPDGCSEVGGIVTCAFGALAVDSSVNRSFIVTVDPSAAGSINNTAMVTGNERDPDSSNNTATASTGIEPPCFTLTLDRTPSGAFPTASPSTTGCPVGTYQAGEAIDLTAFPDAGWSVGSWMGTDDDGSISTSNTATMPVNAHTVSVNYIEDVQPCFPLTSDRTGSGDIPMVDPENSPDCSVGEFHPGELIELTATPDVDWAVGGWSGTDDDASIYPVNTATMPGVAHLVVVDYVPCVAHRVLPLGYAEEQPVPVVINAEPETSVLVYAVEEAPPVGWPVTDIDNNGVFDPNTGTVKWGPFFDNQARALRYSVTPPAGTTGSWDFEGVVSTDGASVLICGDTVLDPASFHPADVGDDWGLQINEITAYGAAWKTGSPWPRPPVQIPINFVTNAGFLWKVGETYHFDPDQNPPWAPGPASAMRQGDPTVASAAVSTFDPLEYTPGVGVEVTIAVVPDVATQVYAVEDGPPVGWTISGISDGGTFDAGNGLVKWGPFFDSLERDLSYIATPPAGAAGAYTFAGQASFDGTNVPIGGDRTMMQDEPECAVDADCDDGSYCNGVEGCNGGVCQAGPAVDCDDGVGCTINACNESTDSCDVVADSGLCDNGLFCDGSETCDPVLGCQAGSDPCDDGVSCTVNFCDESDDTCDYLADDGLCDNGQFCDGQETCDALLDCQAGSNPCTSPLACHEGSDMCLQAEIFTDGFESGDASAWSSVVGE